MLDIRRSSERGLTQTSWLNSQHTFSFGSYRDAKQVGVGPLIVINEDTVAPGEGFASHPHRNMEIISYVIKGTLAHQDSQGNALIIPEGNVQCMSAGQGITHSEYNHSDDSLVHFLQIWVQPNAQNLPPSYQQKNFADALSSNTLTLICSEDGRNGSLKIHQTAALWLCRLNGNTASFIPQFSEQWIQVISGTVAINGIALEAGDGARSRGELQIVASADAELLICDLKLN